jgi:hypothetical protein
MSSARKRAEKQAEDERRRRIELEGILKKVLGDIKAPPVPTGAVSGILGSGVYGPNSPVDETKLMHEKLKTTREKFKPQAKELEDSLRQAADSGFALIIDEVEAIKDEAGISLDIASIKQEFDKQAQKINGSVSGVINRRVALSDSECFDLLGTGSEDEREDGLKSFLDKVVEEGVHNSEESIEQVMNNTLNNVSLIVTNKLNDKKQELQRTADELTAMKNALSESEITAKQTEYCEEQDQLNGFLGTLGAIAGGLIGGAFLGPAGAALGGTLGGSLTGAISNLVS